MVVCKYYRQGNCRNGQYCQYEHINSFGNTNKSSENYNQDEITAVMVAKEVLLVERGGQWLLSCFAPFKERPCIPGMEDLSPEEVRWEMYQAQKNGMVEQAKLQFQQLCQDMKAKRDALKNPTRETIVMLKKIMGTTQKSGNANASNKSSAFAFAAPQLSLSNTSTTSTSVFSSKPFSTQNNPFGNAFNPTTSSTIFGRTNNTAPVFGGTPTFNANLNFGNTNNTNSIFGGSTSSIFGGPQQTAPAFGSIAQQNNPIFGTGQTQSPFGQNNAFATAAQSNNVFGRPQTSQSTVFGSQTSPSNSLFGNTMSSQSTPTLFGGNKTTTATNLFGGPTNQISNSLFGATTSSGNVAVSSASIFGQPKTTAAFGGAPIFGGSNFGNNSSIFGGQPAFAPSTLPAGNIFGGSNTTQPSFGTVNQTSTPNNFSPNAFGVTTSTSNANAFGNMQSAVPTSDGMPFGSVSSTVTPFPSSTFGLPATSTINTFANTITSSGNTFGSGGNGAGFGNSNTIVLPFSTTMFGTTNTLPLTSTTATVVTSTSNPFTPRMQISSSIFGTVPQSQSTTNASINSNSPFGKSPFSTSLMMSVIDETVYSMEGQLTDDEKSMYLAERFILGKIPLKPPTKDIR